jgi:AraC-like DNA-binding protein
MIEEAELQIQHNSGMDDCTDIVANVELSSYVETLFDLLPDVVFFIKDPDGRYRSVNQTLVVRCGLRSKLDLLGHTAAEVFPPPLGTRFLEQDLSVCASGTPITQQLELHLYPTRKEGWCLTDKLPLFGEGGTIFGLVGISRDLQKPGKDGGGYRELAAVIDHVQSHYGHPLRVEELATVTGLSVYQLNRRLGAIFGITASQLITKTRIDAASQMVRSDSSSIAEISFACGYSDQSAFSRVFRRTVGLTPREYRARYLESGE